MIFFLPKAMLHHFQSATHKRLRPSVLIGGGKDSGKTLLLKPLNLDSDEKHALKEFMLEALKGDLVKVRTPEVP